MRAPPGVPLELVRATGFSSAGNVATSLSFEQAERALAEGLAPLLGSRVLAGELAADGAAGAQLVRAHRTCLARELMQQHAIVPALAALQAANIEVVLLKGAALERLVYTRPGVRPRCDTDVLVRASSWRDALRVLESAGGVIGRDDDRALTMSVYHEAHVSLAGRAMLDLHRALAAWPLFRPDNEGIFQRAVPVAGSPGSLLPDSVDLLVMLAMHAAGDGFLLDLRGVCDGLALIKTTGLSPAAVVQRARQWHARTATAVYLAILVTYGLEDIWREAQVELDDGSWVKATATRAIATDVGPSQRSAWRRRWRLARSLDGALRPLAFFGYRGTLRIGDALWRLAS